MEKKLKKRSSGCIKIVLFGPESTGKTTLARLLSEHYDTAWVPEYMRIYLQKKWDETREVCDYNDLIPIAQGQIKLESKVIDKGHDLIFCDTNVLELKVYSEVYYKGEVPELIEKLSSENVYDLYLLTYIDTPWVADDLRDKPNQREEMFSIFKKTLTTYKYPYVVLKGDETSRFKKAVHSIDQLIASKK
ncbi:hypothetical protein GCM10022393_16670 [Aquimarina addita]|uniref:NadR/Ttd14 AAA domain-containing protein n=1 Tax=Aquimarina addita TaxID=870485 RepID=A0ABP7XGX9_9FLAO